MFFETQIQSVNKHVITDVKGRKLSTMGHLPVSAGDNVWTDGRVIFGHVFEGTAKPPIGRPAIPILGDTDTKINGLRGYIERTGKYRDFDIAEGAWITNSKNMYVAETGSLVIDAEINGKTSDLYTAEIKPYRYASGDDKTGSLFQNKANIITMSSVVIKRNGKTTQTFYPANFGAAALVTKMLREEKERYNGINEIKNLYLDDLNSIDCSQLLNFKFDKNGGWTALVASVLDGTYIYEFDYSEESYAIDWDEGPTVPENEDIHTWDFKNDYDERIVELRKYLAARGYKIPETSVLNNVSAMHYALYDQFAVPWALMFFRSGYGYVNEYNLNYEKSAERHANAYYLVQLRYDGTGSDISVHILQEVLFVEKFDKIYKLKQKLGPPRENAHVLMSGFAITMQIQQQLGGVITSDIIYDDREFYSLYDDGTEKYDFEEVEKFNIKTHWDFPIQDDYYADVDEKQLLGCYNPQQQQILGKIDGLYSPTINDILDFYCEDIDCHFYIKKDDDNYSQYCFTVESDKNGVHIEQMPMRNFSIAKLQTGYLFGEHHYKLRTINKNGVTTEVFCDNLKNHRLREMRNIAKAKKSKKVI